MAERSWAVQTVWTSPDGDERLRDLPGHCWFTEMRAGGIWKELGEVSANVAQALIRDQQQRNRAASGPQVEAG